MADHKIVTKKTAVKPAAPTGTKTAATPVAKKTGTTPTAVGSTPSTPAAPAPPAMTKATAAALAAKASTAASPAPVTTAPVTTGKSTTKKTVTKTGEPAAPKADQQPRLEEKPVSLQHLANVTPQHREAMIREAAYYKAEKRNFTNGSDADDWTAAEREIDELLARVRQIYGG